VLSQSKQLDVLFNSMLEQRQALALYNDPYYETGTELSHNPVLLSLIEEANELNETDWDIITTKVLSRGVGDCAICMNMNSCVPYRPLVLLSCSHVFHYQCIESLEKFWDLQSTNLSCSGHTCPVCRAEFHDKRVLDHRLVSRVSK
jgi:hypothetical protein